MVPSGHVLVAGLRHVPRRCGRPGRVLPIDVTDELQGSLAHASVRLVAHKCRMSAVSSTGERVVAGRYRLRRRLGQGAMGTVWEAFDEFLRRPVAVKEVLLPPGMPDEQAAELRERTLREARAIAALSHPNVVTLHDVAREDGEPFVVMEFVHAHSLAALIDVLGPLPADKAAAIADAVAAGLAAAH